ncbi:ATP-binding protein [Reyranella sp. CPCC 100927]|uniref:ATP-binding protein n=1 Tax=Reyranella sp. CPCC 100927 TaxID=2599616 RepID=UPI0011B64946|nr:ATP-binding protein [Reyranella sp. CPCC 100927]TWT13860.1 response regulator [Reyranella sp. CPCC 100927]
MTNWPLLTLSVTTEEDVVRARQRARQLAGLLGFEAQDQTRIATAVSEIARNTVTYGRGGRAEFMLQGKHPAQTLMIRFSDRGPGITELERVLDGSYVSTTGMGVGIAGTRRLMDAFNIQAAPGGGTVVEIGKNLTTKKAPTRARLADVAAMLAQPGAISPLSELEAQNRELLNSLSELKSRQEEVGHLSTELDDTNRGVMALYAELDQRAEALRQASEVKTRFLSNMSHEFRTPLNSILALSRLLLDRTDGDLSAEQEKQVLYIRKSAETLTGMINDLLDIAKVEAGKVDVQIGEFTVGELFGALRGVMRPLLHGETVELLFQERGVIPALHSDEGKISQILRNLISNALKFTERGEVRVTAELHEPDLIVFDVADTGIGIEAQDLGRIFDEFSQVRSSLQSRAKGSGLGLPLSRKLAELLGGRLNVQSTPGQGSVFSLALPADMRTVQDPVAPSVIAERNSAARRVLIIDDEEASRYVLRQFLAGDSRMELTEVESGTEGLRRAQQDKPDLVLLDLKLPGLDGFEIFRTLRGDPATRHIPIVVVTSSLLTDEDQHALAGAAGILSKATLSRPLLSAVLADVWTQIGAAG